MGGDAGIWGLGVDLLGHLGCSRLAKDIREEFAVYGVAVRAKPPDRLAVLADQYGVVLVAGRGVSAPGAGGRSRSCLSVLSSLC